MGKGMFFKKDPLQKPKWEKLHNKNYHPSPEQIIERVTNAKKKNIWLFDDWSKILQMKLDVKNKIVLEIGCGGGWYLVQMLYRGASKVIGFEISQSVINKAKAVFNALNLDNYELYEVDERYLSVLPAKSVDIIFEITVFQHVSEEVTRNYLITSKSLLKDEGLFICQFLMNDTNPIKQPYTKDKEGIVYYANNEVVKMVKDCGLTIFKYSDYDWRDDNNSYWRLYALKTN